jgi:DNA repair ATPase RecN
MATGKDVLEVARDNFEQAQQHRPADLAAAGTPEEVKAVLDNYGAALAAYLECLADAFQAATGNWDALLAEAKEAEKEAKEARQRAENLAKQIEAMGKLTGAVGKLIVAVKG